jgi:hypothetical protein
LCSVKESKTIARAASKKLERIFILIQFLTGE